MAKLNLTTEELFSITTNRLKVKATKRKLPDALPWNGTILASNTEMINTCTIDNMLFAFHVLQTYREDIKDYMKKSQDKILQLLYEIHTLFSQSKFAEGKLKWVVLFPDAKRQKKWNMWGAEEDFSFGKIDCRTTYTNSCTKRLSSPVPTCQIDDFKDNLFQVCLQNSKILTNIYPAKACESDQRLCFATDLVQFL